MTDELTLLDRLNHWALTSPDAPALWWPDGRRLSFAQVAATAMRIRRALVGWGIGGRDRLGLVWPDGPELALMLAASSDLCATTPLGSSQECAQICALSQALDLTHIIVCAELALDAANLPLEAARSALRSDGALGFELTLQVVSKKQGDTKRDPSSRAGLVLTTSGTTSTAKRVSIPAMRMAVAAADIAVALGLRPSDVCLNGLPLQHVSGPFMALFCSWWAGASVICPHGPLTAESLPVLDQRPTWMAAVPTTLTRLSGDHELIAKLSSLAFVHTGAAALHSAEHDRIERAFGCPVIQSYGMTETIMISCNPRPPGARRFGSVGTPRMEVRINDSEGKQLPAGAEGEITVRGPTVLDSYEPDGACTSDGWFRTGDLGSLSTDGYLTVSGRLKEMINRGGMKVLPAEIDLVLELHPAVLEAATFAVPHPSLQEDIAAAVVLVPGLSADEAELRAFARKHLPSRKVPRQIRVVSSIPRTETGKKLRGTLAQETQALTRITKGLDEARRLPDAQELANWVADLTAAHVEPETGFLDAGLDSAGLMELRERLKLVTGRELPLSVLLTHSSPRELASWLRRAAPDPVRAGTAILEPRRLGRSEENWWRASRVAGTGVVVEGVVLEGRVSSGRLRTALDAAQRKHPFLSVHVQIRRGAPHFVEQGTGPIPLLVLRSDSEDLEGLIEANLNDAHFADGSPLLSVTLVRVGTNERRSVLLLRAQHAVWDGSNRLLHEILTLYSSAEPPHQGISMDSIVPAPLDSLVQARPLRKLSWRRVAAWARALAPPTFNDPNPRSATGSRFASTSLSEAATLRVLERCKGRRPSLGHLIAGASVCAYRGLLPRAGRLPVVTLTLVDARQLCATGLPHHGLGVYVSLIRDRLLVGENDTRDEVAARVSERLTEKLYGGDALSFFHAHSWLFALATRLPRRLMRPSCNLALSEVRTYESLASQYGDLRVTKVSGGVSAHGIGPYFSIGFARYRGRLQMTLVSDRARISDATAQAFLDRLVTLLQQDDLTQPIHSPTFNTELTAGI